MDEYRQVFFHELAPGHFVNINMRGPFNCDMYTVLKSFLDQHATKAAPKMFTQEHHNMQGELGYVFHQGCGCSRCYENYERIAAEQASTAQRPVK